MNDLIASDVQDGVVIFSPVSEGDVYEELETKKILRAEDWEVDDEGRKAWEMSFFTIHIPSVTWIPKAGYVYESELVDHFKYKRLYRKDDAMSSVAKLHVPVGFKRKVWPHGNGVQIEIERGTTGTIKVWAIGEYLSAIHASLSCPYTHQTTTEERVGRMVYVKTYTFVTLDKGRPIDVDAVVHVSGKI